MKKVLGAAWIGFFILLSGGSLAEGQSHAERSGPYLGFDRNDYPGDTALPALRKTFRYTSYWFNNPPGETRIVPLSEKQPQIFRFAQDDIQEK